MQIKRVSSGTPFQPRAAEWNAIADAVNEFNANRIRTGARTITAPLDPGVVSIENNSGTDLTRFNILGIDDSLFDPGTQFDQFSERVYLSGVEPAADHVSGRFVVLLEPIKDGTIGRARLVGVCPVQIDVSDEAHEFAEVDPAEYENLISAESGSAFIVAKESGTGVVWAYVALAALAVV